MDVGEGNNHQFEMSKSLTKALITVDGLVQHPIAQTDVVFKIANNKGASSSIFDFGLHSKIWPNVNYTKTIELKSSKLTTMINDENIDIKKFQALLIDTQGSELLVLKGASEILKNFDYIITEAADFESYVGGCKIEDLSIFLKTFGFNPILKTKFAKHSGAGNYYDIIYKKSE